MDNTLVNVYDTFETAENVRQTLLAAGFADVHLTSRDDEASPVQGNFTVGGHQISEGSGHGNNDYDNKFGNPVQLGIFVLTVNADSHRIAHAAEILNRAAPSK